MNRPMDYKTAKNIMRAAAAFCVLGPLIIAAKLLSRYLELMHPEGVDPYAGIRTFFAISATGFAAYAISLWFYIGRSIYRQEAPEKLPSAIAFGGSITFFFPVIGQFEIQNLCIVVAWLPLWGAALFLLNHCLKALEPDITEALRKGPDAKRPE